MTGLVNIMKVDIKHNFNLTPEKRKRFLRHGRYRDTNGELMLAIVDTLPWRLRTFLKNWYRKHIK